MPSSDDINSAFGDQWGLSLLLYMAGTRLDLLLYSLGLLRFRYVTSLGLVSFWYDTGLGLVSFQYYTSSVWSSGVLEFWSFGVDMFLDVST